LNFDLFAALIAFWSPDAILSAPMAAPLTGQPVFLERLKIEQLSRMQTSNKNGIIFFIS